MTNDNINQVNKTAVALAVDDARQRVAAANATADLFTWLVLSFVIFESSNNR